MRTLPASTPLVYVAGPYRGKTPWDVEQNVRRAEALGFEVARLGAYPVIPHTNTRPHFEHLHGDKWWLDSTLALLARCDAAVFTANWEQSVGAKAEMGWCVEHRLPAFIEMPGGTYGGLRLFAGWLELVGRR